MAIRYDKKLEKEINRILRNYNQKINRLIKSEKDYILPAKITKQEIKSQFNTRKELKNYLNQISKFSLRGAEKTITLSTGVSLSKYEYDYLRAEKSRILRQLTREQKVLETTAPTIFGKKQAYSFAKMGDIEYLNLKTRKKALQKDITKLNKDELKRYKELLEKTKSNKEYYNNIFQNNYLDILTSLGYYVGYDNEKLRELENKLINLKPNTFYKLYKSEKAIKSILDYYPIITGRLRDFNPEDIFEDVSDLYNGLIENLDDILESYA